jgi:flavin-dependent dehydrogenase
VIVDARARGRVAHVADREGLRADRRADICVIGAGPAGSVFAARAAQLGFSVHLVERSAFPRAHLGESLTPGVLPLLASVGARAAVEAAGFARVRSVLTTWDHAIAERVDVRESGLLVDRGRFDALLVAHARASGVEVMQPARVSSMQEHADGWTMLVDPADHPETRPLRLHARFVVDATGRHAILGGRRRRTGPRTLALHAYWRGPALPARPRIEAGRDAWYWGVPLPDGSYNTLAFVDADVVRAAPSMPIEARLLALLARSGLMDECPGARMVGPARAADATPYLDDASVTRTSIKVGDSAMALDPLSSSGVQKAIQTALSAAIVVNTLLRRPSDAEAAMEFYRDSLGHASERHRRWAASHYATVAARESDAFWQCRSDAALAPAAPETDLAERSAIVARIASPDPVRLSPDVEFVEIPRLGAEFVGRGSALRHPALDAPVAYLGGWELAPLLRSMRPGMTPMQAVRAWAPGVPLETGIGIAEWLLRHGLLVAAPVPNAAASPH